MPSCRPFASRRIPLLAAKVAKMLSQSFDQWRQNRPGRNRTGRATGAGSSEVVVVDNNTNPSASDGIESFNSMIRKGRENSGRPASAVGSIRSFRSVQTTEEQISAVEDRLDRLEITMKQQKEATDQQNKKLDLVLAAIASKETKKEGTVKK